MFKQVALLIVAFCTVSFAETTETIINPITGEIDYITDTSNLPVGSSGASSLECFIGVPRSSPTASITANTSQFIGSVIGSTFTFTLNSSSVTLLGPTIDSAELPNTMVSSLTITTGGLGINGGSSLNLIYGSFPMNSNSQINWYQLGGLTGSLQVTDTGQNGLVFKSDNGSNITESFANDATDATNDTGFIVFSTGVVRFNDGDNSRYVALRASNTVASNLLFTLPSADGTSAQVLHTDGNKNLYFADDDTAAGGGDNLGSGVGSYGIATTTGGFTGAGGVSVTYGITVGSATVNDLTASQLVVTDANKKLASQSQISDTQIANDAVDGGLGGEIADASVTADDLGVDSVSSSELNATGVEAELEAVMDLQDMQGAVTAGQLPADGYASTYINATGDTMTGQLTNTSSETITGALGFRATYGAVVGSITVNDLTASKWVKTDSNKKLVSADNTISVGTAYDAGTDALTAGSTRYISIPYAATITGWTLLANTTGSMVIDVKKCAGFNCNPTTSIAGSEKPTLSSVWANQDSSLSTWTTAVAANDKIAFVLDSAATLNAATLTIHLNKD